MIELLVAIYLLAAAGLSLYGALGLVTLCLYWRHRRDLFPLPHVSETSLPPVTVQLPIFNERYVVDRLISAVASLDYPADRLQIQVLDDSTDDTTLKATELVQYYRDRGVDISLLRRSHRQGFKAGALSNGMSSAQGEFVAIFDADFQPRPDFLRQTIPHFVKEPRLGMIQARWGHLNDQESPLTAAQALALDKHFAMEQTVRHRADLFPKFNGTGGIWRSACLDDAGGWQADTVCEDLCLSTRAILKGWRFRFLNDVVAPAELPNTISSYKNQQARWAKGSMQCLLKYGMPILKDRQHTLLARLYALLSMSAYATHLLMIMLVLLQLPLVYISYDYPAGWIAFSLAGLGQPLLFVLAQQTLYPDWPARLRHFPTLLMVAIGLAPSNSRAIIQGMLGRRHTFVRTPKGAENGEARAPKGSDGYRLPFDPIILIELALALYAWLGVIMSLVLASAGPLLFLLLSAAGFSLVSYLGMREAFQP